MPITPRASKRRSSWTIIALVLLGVAVGALVAFWRALLFEPAFYRQALDVAAYRQAAASDELEQAVRQLHDRVQHERSWEQIFTDEDLNAWLATELPRQDSRLLPSGVSEPRVVIEPGRVRVAARYEVGGLSTVVSLECEVFQGEEPNVVGLRIGRVRAGAVPIPLDRWVEQATAAARRSNLPIRIDAAGDAPVVLITVPAQSEAWPDRRLTLQRVELLLGRVILGGRSEAR